ncbi:OmpA family protein [Chelativorans composti]|jgi:Outer membrane protein and related peptidoglycan-associated (lipo)proteins|uniref:OmpA family protein n=1 Tax=Chelativorans composti TaxID=768533 RepID=A0ABW5DIB6_9HYPH|nr:OmpA family protein [bacterium SGD-2]
MINRRNALFLFAAATMAPAAALAQPRMPDEGMILRRLEAAPRERIRPEDRVTIEQFKRRPDLRRRAPSIDIQAINFQYDSAEIDPSQYSKVERIASALKRILRTRRGARFLIEGHTDAVGSQEYNLRLSERRAEALKRVLVRRYGLPSHAIDTVGYGKQFLLVQTPYESWENRRVTIRRIDDFIR